MELNDPAWGWNRRFYRPGFKIVAYVRKNDLIFRGGARNRLKRFMYKESLKKVHHPLAIFPVLWLIDQIIGDKFTYVVVQRRLLLVRITKIGHGITGGSAFYHIIHLAVKLKLSIMLPVQPLLRILQRKCQRYQMFTIQPCQNLPFDLMPDLLPGSGHPKIGKEKRRNKGDKKKYVQPSLQSELLSVSSAKVEKWMKKNAKKFARIQFIYIFAESLLGIILI